MRKKLVLLGLSILIVFGIGIITSVLILNVSDNKSEPDEPDEPLPIRKFHYIEVYINFSNEYERDEFLMYDFPYGVYWTELYVDNSFLMYIVIFQNTPYESTHCYLEFVLWKCGLYLGYFRERFGTDEQVYDLYYCGVSRYTPIKEVYLNYSLNAGRSSFLVDLVNAEFPEPSFIHDICDVDTYIEEYYDRSLPDSSKLQVGCHYISFPEPQWESYFFFNYTNKPENLLKAEIRISLVRPNVHNPYNFSIDVYLIEEQWNQFDIKWTNKPNKSDFVRRFDTEYITDGYHDYLLFDITKYANRDNISVLLTPSLDQIHAQNHAYLYSREYSYTVVRPRIIWTKLL